MHEPKSAELRLLIYLTNMQWWESVTQVNPSCGSDDVEAYDDIHYKIEKWRSYQPRSILVFPSSTNHLIIGLIWNAQKGTWICSQQSLKISLNQKFLQNSNLHFWAIRSWIKKKKLRKFEKTRSHLFWWRHWLRYWN